MDDSGVKFLIVYLNKQTNLHVNLNVYFYYVCKNMFIDKRIINFFAHIRKVTFVLPFSWDVHIHEFSLLVLHLGFKAIQHLKKIVKKSLDNIKRSQHPYFEQFLIVLLKKIK